jgi:hypothetical protein
VGQKAGGLVGVSTPAPTRAEPLPFSDD